MTMPSSGQTKAVSETPASASPKARRPPRKPARVLVADDEHLVASGLTENLKALGYEVVGPAANGDEAIELCRSAEPDLALLDVRMPGRDGLSAGKVIFGELGVPVMVLSAYSDDEYLDTGNEIGIFGYLLKPITKDDLRVGISTGWSRYLQSVEQKTEIASLTERLEDRKTIEQAKWLLVKSQGISEPEAQRLLQRKARNHRRKLVQVARSILENEDLLGEE